MLALVQNRHLHNQDLKQGRKVTWVLALTPTCTRACVRACVRANVRMPCRGGCRYVFLYIARFSGRADSEPQQLQRHQQLVTCPCVVMSVWLVFAALTTIFIVRSGSSFLPSVLLFSSPLFMRCSRADRSLLIL